MLISFIKLVIVMDHVITSLFSDACSFYCLPVLWSINSFGHLLFRSLVPIWPRQVKSDSASHAEVEVRPVQ